MDELFQRRPLWSKPSIHKVKSWTESIETYHRSAMQLTQCILHNRRLMKRPYRWFLTINFEDVMEPSLVSSRWKTACDNLRDRGIHALWVKEVSKTNRVHHHLLVKNDMTREELAQVVEQSMPSRKATMRWHKMIKPVKGGWRLAFYITKAKLACYINGRPVADYYARKRLLFKANLGIKKVGTIGSFWERPKGEIWAEITENEKRIGKALERREVRLLVIHVQEMLGNSVPIEKIERPIGLHAESPGVCRWMEQLAVGESNNNYTIR